jgi:hypothetical protein
MIASLVEQFAKARPSLAAGQRLRREDLDLICFEYISS